MFCNIYCITLESERCLLHLRVPCCSICFPKVAQWGSVLCCLTKTRIMQLVHVQERGAFVLLFVELCSETPPPLQHHHKNDMSADLYFWLFLFSTDSSSKRMCIKNKIPPLQRNYVYLGKVFI